MEDGGEDHINVVQPATEACTEEADQTEEPEASVKNMDDRNPSALIPSHLYTASSYLTLKTHAFTNKQNQRFSIMKKRRYGTGFHSIITLSIPIIYMHGYKLMPQNECTSDIC